MTHKIVFIGAGNMAGAIIRGILKNGIAEPCDLAVYDISEDQSAKFEKLGLNVMRSLKDAAEFSDVIFLSVKPQNYEEVLVGLSQSINEKKLLVSIAAGISTAYIKSRIGFDCKVIRVMPNTPLLLGCGATAMCHCKPVDDEEFALVKGIFSSSGIVEVLPEEKMNAVIAVNGSSPAYVYLFAKAVIDGALLLGIDAAAAKTLICKTLEGAALMLMESGKEPDELIKMVSSKGGTTVKALEALYEHDFEDALIDAMKRCTDRAEELGR